MSAPSKEYVHSSALPSSSLVRKESEVLVDNEYQTALDKLFDNDSEQEDDYSDMGRILGR